MLRTVVLLHTLPDGSSHFDWMLEQPGRGDLVTFRCTRSPHEAGQWDAERLPDHRRVYLDYEGPISGNRGDVRRVASGEVLEADLESELPRATCDFAGVGTVACSASRRDGVTLRFVAARD